MKYVSLFAGIGGFDLALNRLGHQCVYANEWDKYSAQTYEKNFGHKPDTRSIIDVPTTDIPNHDILVGGFPCQSFSIAGKRRGFEDTRGTLFHEIARIARDKRPTYLFLENVKGLLSHDHGRTFETILRTFDELGYDLQWQVLNSKDFGVPQNRERIFIIGHPRGQPRPKVFPIGAEQKKIIQAGNEQLVAGTISTKNQSGQAQWDGSTTLVLQHSRSGKTTKYNMRKSFGTVKPPSGNTRNLIMQRSHGFFGGNEKALAPSIRGSSVAHNVFVNRIRRLTPIECERLQGFPDNWTAGVSDTQRYKQLGNAVTVNTVYEVAKRAFRNS